MTVEERLQELIKERYGSVLKFSQAAGLANSTTVGVLQRGVGKSGYQTLSRICDELNISVEALGEGRIVPLYERRAGVEQAENIISSAVTAIYDTETVTFGEVPLTDDERKLLANALELSLELLKRGRR